MPAKTAQQKSPIIRNLVGGLNVRENICDLGDNELYAATNITYYTSGALVRRGGWKKLFSNSPTSNPLTGIFQAVFTDTSTGSLNKYLVITDGASLWYTADETASPVAWTDITGSITLDQVNPYKFIMMANKLIGYNGNSAPFYWTGTGNAQSFTDPDSSSNQFVPISRCAIVWQNYLFWVGCKTRQYSDSGYTGAPMRTVFSDLGDPTVYPTANFVDIPTPNDGDPLTGAAILYGNLMLLKRFSLYILQGAPPSNMILSKLNSSVGCVDPASVVQIDNLVYFVSDRGLYAANLFNVRQVCYKVEPRYLAGVPASSAANPIWAANYRHRGQIYVAINCSSLYSSAQTNNDRLLVHDYFNADKNGDPATSEYVAGYTAYSMSAAKPSNPTAPSLLGDYQSTINNDVTVMASFYDEWVYVMTEGTLGNGGPADEISWMTQPQYPPTDALTKFYDMGDPNMIKVVRWVWTTGQNYNSSNLGAGIVYNNSPTALSFVDYNTGVTVLESPNGNLWQLNVADDGSIFPTPTSDPTYLVTLLLPDANDQIWVIGIDNDGALTTSRSSGTALANPILVSSGGYQYVIGVDVDGALTSSSFFAPTTVTIVPGSRSVVPPLVAGLNVGRNQGKYVQFYFVNIGILTQFSWDVILKGRRN